MGAIRHYFFPICVRVCIPVPDLGLRSSLIASPYLRPTVVRYVTTQWTRPDASSVGVVARAVPHANGLRPRPKATNTNCAQEHRFVMSPYGVAALP